MTPSQKIKYLILLKLIEWGEFTLNEEVTSDNVDSLYDEASENDSFSDAVEEVRVCGVETNLECEYSRHYESTAVADKLPDGSWVGWTYWYGGGKHGEPSAIGWISDAYDVKCVEEEKLVVVRNFSN